MGAPPSFPARLTGWSTSATLASTVAQRDSSPPPRPTWMPRPVPVATGAQRGKAESPIVGLDIERRPRLAGLALADTAIDPGAAASVDHRVTATGEALQSPAEQPSVERHQRPVIRGADLEMDYCVSHCAGSFAGNGPCRPVPFNVPLGR